MTPPADRDETERTVTSDRERSVTDTEDSGRRLSARLGGFDRFLSGRTRAARRRLVAALFGDRIGLTLFLGVVLALSLCWRVGFFIADTYAIANTVVNVAEGHFDIQRIEYSLTLGSQPGLYRNGSQVFGRNYAVAILSLPFYWILEGASALVELRLVLAAGWSVLAAAFAAQLGRVLANRRVAFWGTLFALGMFVCNVWLARPLDPHWTALLALQVSTLLAAGVVAVAVYRLLGEFHDRRVGLAAGLLSTLALPIAFWATIPKRHVVSAALITIVVCAFALSRHPERSSLVRASAYAAVAVLAWLHAAEALVVFVVLAPVDLATAPRNDRRTLSVVAAVFALSLVPFVVTNLAVTGSPFETPRMLDSLGSAGQIGPDGRVSIEPEAPPTTPTPTTPAEPTAPGTTPGTAPPSDPDGGPLGWFVGLVEGLVATGAAILVAVPGRLGQLWGFVDEGISIVLGDPERLGHVFLRSGRVPGIEYTINDQEAIELTVLESAPVLGLLAVAPLVWGRQALTASLASVRRAPAAIRSNPRYQTDLLAGGIVVMFTLLYLPRLPLYSQITMRYLVPAMPVALYGVARVPAVRRALDEQFHEFVRAYLTASLVGVVGVVVALGWIDPALGEAMQFHALLNLAVAGVAALIVVVATARDREEGVATAVGTAGGAATTLFVLAGVEYFDYGEYTFAITRWLSELLPIF
ncbi:hypothetical protein [Halapricum salinum]|uniref:hypothetical protein n=1 Tax=Halapricum salinum TaxID=1457250 RepID=UPI001F185261|nr:hypothetical protein [Halapricum salinum]